MTLTIQERRIAPKQWVLDIIGGNGSPVTLQDIYDSREAARRAKAALLAPEPKTWKWRYQLEQEEAAEEQKLAMKAAG